VDKADQTNRVVEGLQDLARQLGATTAQLALAWLLRQPGVTSPIPGTTNPDRARDNARAGDLILTDTVAAAIEDLIPFGPAFA
jgi:aryl-alcohol dehydrogenase-like predicted oxidoreductase